MPLLTTTAWKPGSYELTAWIVGPGASTQPMNFTGTIEVKPKLQAGLASADPAKTAI